MEILDQSIDVNHKWTQTIIAIDTIPQLNHLTLPSKIEPKEPYFDVFEKLYKIAGQQLIRVDVDNERHIAQLSYVKKKELTPEQQKLAVAFIPLARKMTKKYKKLYPDRWEEFESASMMALVLSAERYNEDYGITFYTYVRRRILGSIKDVVRAKKKQLLHLDYDPSYSVEIDDFIAVMFRRLRPIQVQVCTAIYLEGQSQDEIARKLQCSQARICRIHLQSLEHMRAIL
jgi:RNA polymerase sigma factor (sigma-70 family)